MRRPWCSECRESRARDKRRRKQQRDSLRRAREISRRTRIEDRHIRGQHDRIAIERHERFLSEDGL